MTGHDDSTHARDDSRFRVGTRVFTGITFNTGQRAHDPPPQFHRNKSSHAVPHSHRIAHAQLLEYGRPGCGSETGNEFTVLRNEKDKHTDENGENYVRRTACVWRRRTACFWRRRTACFWRRRTACFWRRRTACFWRCARGIQTRHPNSGGGLWTRKCCTRRSGDTPG